MYVRVNPSSLLLFHLFRGKNKVWVSSLRRGRKNMKCYVCAKQGVDKDAVAICIVCGMGLCLGHAFKEELLVKDIVDWGFGEERIEYPHTLPRFICAECKLAREQRIRVVKGKGQT
jgi:hypothetical protein